ncbi:hypothetical protein FIBSPDRAFT_938276 [Athelia psychrophila]|uniref:Uncharacterized protein n=1 Tax=Athelia psychrophila TaxID=1759441 RepID=A0A165YSY5_9AGAM|nr:hypothetical protein FIBSPDRAFT_938276 [Fibularhizoctonia sp. CBS 109695]
MQPTLLNGDLTSSLNKVFNWLSSLGRCEEDLAPAQQAVELHRALAADSERPKVFNGDLALSLNNLFNRSSNLSRREEALAPIQQAVDLRRVLAAELPKVFNSDLALSLNMLRQRSHLTAQGSPLTTLLRAVTKVHEWPNGFNTNTEYSQPGADEGIFQHLCMRPWTDVTRSTPTIPLDISVSTPGRHSFQNHQPSFQLSPRPFWGGGLVYNNWHVPSGFAILQSRLGIDFLKAVMSQLGTANAPLVPKQENMALPLR